MQLRDKKSATSPRVAVVVIAIFLMAAFASLAGCGSSSTSPQTRLYVVEYGNSRVLIYNAPFTTGESASVVLGQAAFNVDVVGPPATATGMGLPLMAALDSAGNLYVSDYSLHRVLQFTPPFTTGMAAGLAVGQAAGATNLTTNAQTLSAAGMSGPDGIAVDSSGNLWVADSNWGRVLMYPAPITAGEAATVVLGQPSGAFAGCNQFLAAPTANTLCNPTAIAFDSSGNLWVVDNSNQRVLMYPKANLVTDGAATVELGQPAATAFTSSTANNGGISATSLNFGVGILGTGLAFDSTGNLWVSDVGNNRVLMYPKANLVINGAATVELGQPAATAFTSGVANNGGISASTLAGPCELAFDSNGDLAVTDFSNSRTLGFTPPFTTGMAASVVLGQANFTTGTANTGGEGAATQNEPIGVAF